MGSQVHLKFIKIHQAQLLPMVEMHTMAHLAISSSANVLPIARCRAVGQKDAAAIQPTLSLGRFLGQEVPCPSIGPRETHNHQGVGGKIIDIVANEWDGLWLVFFEQVFVVFSPVTDGHNSWSWRMWATRAETTIHPALSDKAGWDTGDLWWIWTQEKVRNTRYDMVWPADLAFLSNEKPSSGY